MRRGEQSGVRDDNHGEDVAARGTAANIRNRRVGSSRGRRRDQQDEGAEARSMMIAHGLLRVRESEQAGSAIGAEREARDRCMRKSTGGSGTEQRR